MRRILDILTKNRIPINKGIRTPNYLNKKSVFLSWLPVVLIIAVGIFLRCYRLNEFAMFLSDQGRDAIVIKRILTGEHFPAIGAPTSVGQVYLGPFYYYFIAPWLLIFNFKPVGLAFGVAFFSSLFLLLNFIFVRKLVNEKTALISTIFLSFSSVLIDFSRFSWNPNLLPLFSFLTAYFVIESLRTKKWYYFFAAGAFLSFSIQLHYLALLLSFPVFIIYLFDLIKKIKKNTQEALKQFNNYLLAVSSFILFTFPLIIFDLRHNFLNSRNFLTLFKTSSDLTSGKLTNLVNTFTTLNIFSLNITLNEWQSISLLVVIILSGLIIIFRTKGWIKYFIFFFLTLFLGISLYSGTKFPHYLGFVYPFYYIIIGYFLAEISDNLFEKIILVIFIIFFIVLNFPQYKFLTQPAANQIGHSEKVADFLAEKINHQPFNIATWPVDFTEDSYLYFLELKGIRPADRRKVEITNQMFVLCNKDPCRVIDSPSWNISMFGKAKITAEWQVEDVKIYKLIR